MLSSFKGKQEAEVRHVAVAPLEQVDGLLYMSPGARHEVCVKRAVAISLHFVVVMKWLVKTAPDELFAYQTTLQLLLKTFRILLEQDTVMTLEQLRQLR